MIAQFLIKLKEITTIIVLLFLVISCGNDDEPYTNGEKITEETGKTFKFSNSEITNNVNEFLNDFVSKNDKVKGTDSNFDSYGIKSIRLITKNDISQTNILKNSNKFVDDSLVYIVSLEDGFVIAGGDKRTIPILGFVEQGSFSEDIFLGHSEKEHPIAAYLSRTIDRIQDDINDNVIYEAMETKAYPIKEKVYALIKTRWGQRNPYNLYNPEGKPYAGCGITAIAQISAYYKAPKYIKYPQNIENPLRKEFPVNLNWDKILSTSSSNYGVMPYKYSNIINSEKDIDDVISLALYMRYVGYTIGANYGATSTGSDLGRIISYLRNNIGLQATDKHKYNLTNIYNHIKGGNLVLLTAYKNSSGAFLGLGSKRSDGHAWLLDGFFKTNHNRYYFHYNWGWNGDYNGYFFDDRWNPGKSEFDDNGNEKGQGDVGANYKYGLGASYMSW